MVVHNWGACSYLGGYEEQARDSFLITTRANVYGDDEDHGGGRGGFGSVVLCKNKLDRQEYAVKKVLSSNVEKIEKTLREARILAKLYNERIVRYYQAWTEVGFPSKKKKLEPDENVSGSGGSLSDESFNGSDSSNGGEVTYLYIQMEYCLRTLRRHFDLVDAPAEKNFALNVLRQIAEGLKYLHDQGIIHRDLTPSNKIGDFGLAKFLEAKQVASGPSSSKAPDYEISSGGANAYTSPEIGAITYSAPEVVVRDPDIDGKVDIFSLGIIYFELFNYFRTGSERLRALTDLRLKSELPSSWIQDYPDQVHWVEWLTSQHPENRPTASELLDALLDIW